MRTCVCPFMCTCAFFFGSFEYLTRAWTGDGGIRATKLRLAENSGRNAFQKVILTLKREMVAHT